VFFRPEVVVVDLYGATIKEVKVLVSTGSFTLSFNVD
jgi:hypothetical protein